MLRSRSFIAFILHLVLSVFCETVLGEFPLETPASSDVTRGLDVFTVDDCDILIAGGSLAALASAVTSANLTRSAKSPKKTCLLEPTDWAGGQLTAGNVPPDFGMYNRYSENLPRDFVALLSKITGDWESNPGVCWVSTKCFDANVAAAYIGSLLTSFEPELSVYYNTVVKSTRVVDGRAIGLEAVQRTRRRKLVDGEYVDGLRADLSDELSDWYSRKDSDTYIKRSISFTSFDVLIEASELGDVLMTASSSSSFQSSSSKEETDVIVSQGVEYPLEKSISYITDCGQKTVFPFTISYGYEIPQWPNNENSVPEGDAGGSAFSFENINWTENWSYRRSYTPNPTAAESSIESVSPGEQSSQNLDNDYADGYLFLSLQDALRQAKSEGGEGWQGGVNITTLKGAEQRSFGWFHYVLEQSPGSVRPLLGINYTQTGTSNALSKFPYVRDTRRSRTGLGGFKLMYSDLNYSDPAYPDGGRTGKRFDDTVALGDYFYADVHRLSDSVCAYPDYIAGSEHPVKPYYIPFRALTNEITQNILFPGKAMSQSFLANAATRLHPVEWSTGTAAGATAFLMTQNTWRTVQEVYEKVDILQSTLTSEPIMSPLEWNLDVPVSSGIASAINIASPKESKADNGSRNMRRKIGAESRKASGIDSSFPKDAPSLLQSSWLPVSYGCENASALLDTFTSLKSKGVRRVYVDVWNNGVVYFDSPTLLAEVGQGAIGRDILSWALQAANVTGMEVVAWFEYGLMASYNSLSATDFARYASSKGWIIGEYNSFYWMDASNPDVLDFLADILIDALQYTDRGLLGVQLDDHFSQPVSLGGTPEVMDQAMATVRSQLSQRCSSQSAILNSCMLSLSPATFDTALNTYSVDWASWGDKGYYDEVIPQLYRSTFDAFKSAFDETWKGLSEYSKKLWIASGLRLDGSGDPTAWSELSKMIDYTTDNGIGCSVWYSRGILETYPDEFSDIW